MSLLHTEDKDVLWDIIHDTEHIVGFEGCVQNAFWMLNAPPPSVHYRLMEVVLHYNKEIPEWYFAKYATADEKPMWEEYVARDSQHPL